MRGCIFFCLFLRRKDEDVAFECLFGRRISGVQETDCKEGEREATPHVGCSRCCRNEDGIARRSKDALRGAKLSGDRVSLCARPCDCESWCIGGFAPPADLLMLCYVEPVMEERPDAVKNAIMAIFSSPACCWPVASPHFQRTGLRWRQQAKTLEIANWRIPTGEGIVHVPQRRSRWWSQMLCVRSQCKLLCLDGGSRI